jgi:glycosyltransferase involved in cell wall biosynthesis
MSVISIVTINYNNAPGLADTIASVLSQQVETIEYLIIDGGSTDGSVDVIRAHAGRLAFWVSEPDRGRFHAMNKGLGRATGQYVLFLNSGDAFSGPEALGRLVAESDDRDLVYGDLIVEAPGRRWRWAGPPVLTFDYFRTSSLPHPATLIKRSLFADGTGYDESRHIVSDWIFFMNAVCLRGATYTYVSHPITIFRTGGISTTPAHAPLLARERGEALREFYGAFLPDYREHDRRRLDLDAVHRSWGYRLERSFRELGRRLHMGRPAKR